MLPGQPCNILRSHPSRTLEIPELSFHSEFLLDHKLFGKLHMLQHNVPRHRTIAGSQRFQDTQLILASFAHSSRFAGSNKRLPVVTTTMFQP